MTRTYDVTSTFVQTIDADPGTAEEVLAAIDPMRSLVDRLMAFGLDDRAIWSTGGQTHSLIWRFGPDAGHARFDWKVAVETDGNGGATLSLEVGGRGSDPDARVRVLRAWHLVEELSKGHTGRLARMVEDHAEEERVAVPAPRLAAVGMGL
ncbi:MAG: hypothetical protein ACM3QU_07820 [Verrucomicrobiota bacterium]